MEGEGWLRLAILSKAKLKQRGECVVSELSKNCQKHVKSSARQEVWITRVRICTPVGSAYGDGILGVIVIRIRWGNVVQAVLILVGRREIEIL